MYREQCHTSRNSEATRRAQWRVQPAARAPLRTQDRYRRLPRATKTINKPRKNDQPNEIKMHRLHWIDCYYNREKSPIFPPPPRPFFFILNLTFCLFYLRGIEWLIRNGLEKMSCINGEKSHRYVLIFRAITVFVIETIEISRRLKI